MVRDERESVSKFVLLKCLREHVSNRSTFKRVDEVLEGGVAGAEAVFVRNVLHGALDDGVQHAFLGGLVLGAEHDQPLVVVAAERSPEMLYKMV